MLSKIIFLAGLVCLTAAALEPISDLKKQLRGFQNDKDAVQVQSSLSSTDCELNTKKVNPLNPQTYFQCTRNGLALMKCPDKMIFETASSACIKLNTPPAGVKAPTCPAVDGEFPTYFPSTPDCEGFYQCSNGQAYYFSCPDGTRFNPSISVCDWPWNVQSCTVGGGGGVFYVEFPFGEKKSRENADAEIETKIKGAVEKNSLV